MKAILSVYFSKNVRIFQRFPLLTNYDSETKLGLGLHEI